MTLGPSGTALVVAVRARWAVPDRVEPLVAVAPCRDPEPARLAAREMSERVNVKMDTP
jgi:hypothetical protein